MPKYILMLKNEQSGLLNDLIRKLGTVPEGEKVEIQMDKITAKGWWKKDILTCEFKGLVYNTKPEIKKENQAMLPDGKTVQVCDIIASSDEL